MYRITEMEITADMQLRKAWSKFFAGTLLIIGLLCAVMMVVFYNSSVSRESDRTQTIEEFVRNQKLDLIKNVVNNMISEINMQKLLATERADAEAEDVRKTAIYNATVEAVQLYADGQVPLGDVEIRVDVLNNYDLNGDFATRIITPFFQPGDTVSINAGNADYYDVFEQLVQNGDAFAEYTSNGHLERIVYARLYRPYDWVVSASVSASDINQLTDMLSAQFQEQQNRYILVFLLLCLMFTAAAIAIFTRLGRLFFLRADNEFKEIYDLSYVDSLTEIHNRRYLDDTLEKTIDHLSRVDNSELSLLLIDIDHFKLFNDTYGHQRGDECLKKVAQSLAGALYRATDVTARYGGEEFAVVLPYTGAAGSRVVAEKLLDCVHALNIPHESSKTAPYVTISIGVMSAKVWHTHDRRDYLKSADKALYMSKSNGRDRYTYLDFREDNKK